ncbi:MAG: hypothetical protein KAY54_03685 [Burkholderiaceae bacterium]|nr:hypothetical protein [Burkholderiaceae bacterium]
MALITVQVDHYHHIPQPPEIPASIQERLDRIMTTQAELALQIAALTEQNEKARAEVLAKIADMQAALDAAGAVDPAVLTAFDSLKASVQADDDIVPDA